jgi:fatty-acyl-CoA synthase
VPGSTGPTVQSLLAGAFRRYAREPCLLWEGGSARYSETADRVGRLASWLVGHTRETKHVAIALPNGREYLECILACALGNLVRVPLGAKEPVEVLSAKLAESSTEVLIATPTVLDGVADWVRESGCAAVAVGDLAVVAADADYPRIVESGAWTMPPAGVETDRFRLSFTGGTTGVAKAVVQTHRQERALIRNLLLETVRPGAGRTFVAATPLAHASGALILPTVLRGGSLAWLERFDAGRLTDSSWLASGRRRWATSPRPRKPGGTIWPRSCTAAHRARPRCWRLRWTRSAPTRSSRCTARPRLR